MGRKGSKATENIYYIARIRAAEKNGTFSSREKAALQLGIERSRLARIELDKIEPYAEEVLIMSREYNAPYLCEDFCRNVCPIGNERVLGRHRKAVQVDSLERLSLQFLSSAQSIEDISRILINISKDGKITEEEYESFHNVLRAMDEISDNIRSIKAYIDSNPNLRARFDADLRI